jgi:hypothetical protein
MGRPIARRLVVWHGADQKGLRRDGLTRKKIEGHTPALA